ncbi:glycosyltransferase family 4 protein [Candidatus Daviesbacteria bacterium]|nr:glycosyltransferase family 4 protein [Candidatus Daviesbacteria bacterium]
MGDKKEKELKIAINIHPLKTGHKDRGTGLYTINLLENLKKDNSLIIQEFANLSEVEDADVIHFPWFDFFFHTLPIKRKFKTIVTIHDTIPLVFPNYYPVGLRGQFNFFLQKLALNTCKSIITDSRVSKDDIVEYLKIEKEKISTVYLAANENFKPQSDTKLLHIKRKYHLPDRFLLYVGDANWVKNLPFLIEGFNNLIKTPNFSDVKLALIGGVFLKKVENIDHPELESLKKVNELIKKNNLDKYILRPGGLDLNELVCFYNLATLYVQPSLYEGFGLPVIEALSCGTPVASSNKGSLLETGGNAVIYFDPSNLNQFISILKEVLQDKSLQDKLSKLGLKRVKDFSWEKALKETKDIYLKTLRND